MKIELWIKIIFFCRSNVNNSGILTFAGGQATVSTINADSGGTVNFAGGQLVVTTINLSSGVMTGGATVDLRVNTLNIDATTPPVALMLPVGDFQAGAPIIIMVGILVLAQL